MKKIMSLILAVMALLTAIPVNGAAIAEEISNSKIPLYTVEKQYTYPITPGTTPEIWKSFTTHQEMVDACQIPENIVKNMSTPELLVACTDYPLAGDALLFNTLSAGFSSVYQQFDAMQVLFERDDFSYELVKYVESVNLKSLKKEAHIPAMKLSFIFAIINSALDKNILNDQECKVITNKCITLARSINAFYSDIYGVYALTYLFETLKKEGCLPTKSALTGVYTFTTTTVSTPKNTSVAALSLYGNDLNSTDYQMFLDIATDIYPNASIVAYPTFRYNCHSYAWHQQSTSNSIWIDYPTAYMTDGSYNRKSVGSNYYPGHGIKVYYSTSNPDYAHSAIVYNSTQYISKWGAGCLMRHTYAYCPYSNYTLKFYERNYS